MTFHGSPGGPRDFSSLETLLSGEYIHTQRYNNNAPERSIDPREDLILIGYSWGSRELLRYYECNRNQVNAIILISPYIFNVKSSLIRNIVLNIPVVSGLILSKIGIKATEEFIVESSYPLAPPPEYYQFAGDLSQNEVLKASLLEKDKVNATDIKNINVSANVLVIWGSEDKKSSRATQIEPIIDCLNGAKLAVIDGAGHALPWTSPHVLQQLISKFLDNS